MNAPRRQIILLFLAAALFSGPAARAQNLGQIGVTLLRAITTNVDGSGIRVAQPEASLSTNSPIWEVNPANASVGQPGTLFTYISDTGSTNNFPNALGSESSHADSVAGNFYGIPGGVATNVAHVDNYDADFFFSNYVSNLLPMPTAAIVNQSFTFGALDVTDQLQVDSAYDDYSETFGTLFVSAANNIGNNPTVCAPGTAYNCISVGAYANGTYYNSIGPTSDNGRCKPDITALSSVTSFSTPQVAGAAALLMQAALRGDGGGDTNSASDIRTIKALLLNGAIKPAGWTNSNSSPLDARYGAGVLNVFNSYEQLAGGKQNFTVSTFGPAGSPHPPPANPNSIAVLSGWDFNTNSTSTTSDGVNHYFFNVTNESGSGWLTATATLVWNRQLGRTNINDLDLFLFNAANSNLVACSTSRVDNVEHLWLPQLPPGRYDLQVLKNGGTDTVSDAETYALAWEFFSEPLQIAQVETNAALSWPVYPAGFTLESATNLASPAVWTTNNIPPPVVTNNQNYILLDETNVNRFFRLRRP
ncbi:MAG TPA: S8 family serine peptidase [Candidatus Paceibacterota bacterium]|nr:S8 family serine peptidase [Candidatus Paceibacterota bacterium]